MLPCWARDDDDQHLGNAALPHSVKEGIVGRPSAGRRAWVALLCASPVALLAVRAQQRLQGEQGTAVTVWPIK